MKQRGFTVVELLVVIVIIGILVSLGTVQLLRSQPVARDKARADDISTVALALEGVYQNGQLDSNIIPSGNGSVTNATPMGYPSTALITATSDPQTIGILGNIDERALKSPRVLGGAVSPNFSLTAATNNTATPWASAPSASNDVYVYQPLDASGALCQFATGNSATGVGGSASQQVIAPRLIDNCVRFIIYYYSEAKNAVQTVTSTGRSANGL